MPGFWHHRLLKSTRLIVPGTSVVRLLLDGPTKFSLGAVLEARVGWLGAMLRIQVRKGGTGN